jgi:hypothetical protein
MHLRFNLFTLELFTRPHRRGFRVNSTPLTLGQFLRVAVGQKRPPEILRGVQNIALSESSIGRFLELAPYGPRLLYRAIWYLLHRNSISCLPAAGPPEETNRCNTMTNV